MAKKKKRDTQAVDVETVREQLLVQREELLKGSNNHYVDAPDSVRGDLVDQSTDLSERELLLGLAEGDREKLREIDAALEMMDKNTYGICEMCSEPIPIKRLLAVPTARYCVSCKSKAERGG